MTPSGRAGKDVIFEKARLFEMAAEPNHPLEHIALKAVAVMEHLLLQKTHPKAKAKDNANALDRRLALWKRGDVAALLEEAVALQERLPAPKAPMAAEQAARVFARLVFQGRVGAAMRVLERQAEKAGFVQKLTPEVIATLKKLHPPAQPAVDEALIQGIPPEVHPVIYDALTAEEIKKAALRSSGAAGVSGGDADFWKRQLSSFGTASAGLCEAMAALARRLCTEYVDPSVLEAFVANRLIPLDKRPGTRPIGIGEMPKAHHWQSSRGSVEE